MASSGPRSFWESQQRLRQFLYEQQMDCIASQVNGNKLKLLSQGTSTIHISNFYFYQKAVLSPDVSVRTCVST